jgi:serine/threonine protein kinase
MAVNQYPNSLPVGTKLLWYEIRGVLGQGGFGITYLAHDTNLDQAVALKEYLPSTFATRGTDLVIALTATAHQADFAWGLQRFLEEGRVLARFDHPAIVRVHSVFEANATAYLVMRYERGETLEALLKRERRLDEIRLRAILDDVIPGLAQLHAAGYIHRDIKPGNLYLRENGQALLIDFGAARQALSSQTQALTSLVSPGYAPFEQYRSDGSAQGPWTDVYALGATAYRAITGRAPMPAVDRSHRILEGHGEVLPALADAGISQYSWELLAAVDRALAFRPADRPQTVTVWHEMIATVEPITGVNAATVSSREFAPNVQEIDDSALAVTVKTQPITLPITVVEPPRARRRRTPWMISAGLVVAGALSWVGYREYTARQPTEFIVPAPNERVAPVADSSAIVAVPSPAPTVNPIPGLLAAAESDLAALRLSTPAGNNALEMYREVLRLDPDNRAAQDGLERIVGRYVELAAAATDRRDFDSARDYLGIASGIKPGDARVQAAKLTLARRETAANVPTPVARVAPPQVTSPLGNAYRQFIVRPTKNGVAKVRRAWRKNWQRVTR